MLQKVVETMFSQPFDFVSKDSEGNRNNKDGPGSRKHTVLFYEDAEYASAIVYRYIKAGLQQGQLCGFVSELSPDLVEREMRDNDIDVDKAKKRRLLQLFHVGDLTIHPRHTEMNVEDMAERLRKKTNRPFERLVFKCIFKIESDDQLKANMKIEAKHNSVFQPFPANSLLVTFPVPEIIDTLKGNTGTKSEWMAQLLEEYDAVIFARQFNRGIAFSLV